MKAIKTSYQIIADETNKYGKISPLSDNLACVKRFLSDHHNLKPRDSETMARKWSMRDRSHTFLLMAKIETAELSKTL